MSEFAGLKPTLKKLPLSVFFILLVNSVSADQLDGLAFLDFLIYIILLGAVSLFLLLVASLIRFSRSKPKVSLILNFSATTVVLCSLISIDNLGSGIDPGFLAFCIGCTALSILLVILNNSVGAKKRRINRNEQNIK